MIARSIEQVEVELPRVAVVLVFVFIGFTKFNNDPRSEWLKIVEPIGFGQWFRYFTGVVQITGALLMLAP